jgi:hypothetical protein
MLTVGPDQKEITDFPVTFRWITGDLDCRGQELGLGVHVQLVWPDGQPSFISGDSLQDWQAACALLARMRAYRQPVDTVIP